MDLKKVKATNHAINRMQKRSISWPIVQAVILHGRQEPGRKGAIKHVLNGFCVILKAGVIVTAYQMKGIKKNGKKKKGYSEGKILKKTQKSGQTGRGRGKAAGYFVP